MPNYNFHCPACKTYHPDVMVRIQAFEDAQAGRDQVPCALCAGPMENVFSVAGGIRFDGKWEDVERSKTELKLHRRNHRISQMDDQKRKWYSDMMKAAGRRPKQPSSDIQSNLQPATGCLSVRSQKPQDTFQVSCPGCQSPLYSSDLGVPASLEVAGVVGAWCRTCSVFFDAEAEPLT